MRSRHIKKWLLTRLGQEDIQRALSEIMALKPEVVINPLFSLLLSTDPMVKWHTVTAFGLTVGRLAEKDMESARVIIRRLMWQLNDESGGIGWGCPEAMGESLARHRGIGQEYSKVLISYLAKDGNLLEHVPLQRGAIWAVGRLGESSPDLARPSVPHLLPLLNSQDPNARGLSAWALGLLGAKEALSNLYRLLHDQSFVEIYRDLKVQHVKVRDLALEAIQAMEKTF